MNVGGGAEGERNVSSLHAECEEPELTTRDQDLSRETKSRILNQLCHEGPPLVSSLEGREENPMLTEHLQ